MEGSCSTTDRETGSSRRFPHLHSPASPATVPPFAPDLRMALYPCIFDIFPCCMHTMAYQYCFCQRVSYRKRDFPKAGGGFSRSCLLHSLLTVLTYPYSVGVHIKIQFLNIFSWEPSTPLLSSSLSPSILTGFFSSGKEEDLKQHKMFRIISVPQFLFLVDSGGLHKKLTQIDHLFPISTSDSHSSMSASDRSQVEFSPFFSFQPHS